ncbi:MAG TPA: hypothetical protein VHG91_15035 [Longimicrobium sp.]|nr:hypothetical protein [Longimicrobium sp.]
MPHRFRALTLSLAFAAACGPGDEPASESPPADPIATPVAAETAATAPSATDVAYGLAEWGLGPLRVGMTEEEARAALGGAWSPLAADGETEGCRYARSAALPPGVLVMLDSGRVRRVEVDSGATATAAGARIGDSAERVRQLYPGLREGPHKYTAGKYLVALPGAPADTVHRIVFETDSAGTVTRFRGGALPHVEYVEGCS